MGSRETGPVEARKSPAAIASEAAVWLVLLLAPDRDEVAVEAWRRWMAEDPSHEAAFEEAVKVWRAVKSLKGSRRVRARAAVADSGAQRIPLWSLGVTAAAVLISVSICLWHVLRPTQVFTGLGEQRSLILEDGSLVMLNTSSRLVLRYDNGERRVVLEQGEAEFDVAKNVRRPFVTAVDSHDIVATGTRFIARKEGNRSSMVLFEGSVQVKSRDESTGLLRNQKMQPGDQLVFSKGASDPIVSHYVDLDAIAAWKQGKARFNRTPLHQAVAEINRYNSTQIVIDNQKIQSIPVDGLADVRKPAAFAEKLADAYGISVTNRDGEIHLDAASP